MTDLAQQASDPATPQAHALLRAALATDPRGCWLLSPEGEPLFANAEADSLGPLSVVPCDSVSLRDACLTAQSKGCARLMLRDGLPAEVFALDQGKQGHLYLLRAEQPEGPAFSQVAAMAHDLRAPLQALILAAEGVGAAEVDRTEIAALARVALDQITHVLDSASESAVAQVRPLDLIGLLRHLGKMMSPLLQARGNYLHLDLPATPLWVMAREQPIRLIVQNLLGNANRSTANGQIVLRLTLSQEEGAAALPICIEVEDRGPGLSEAELHAYLRSEPSRAGQSGERAADSHGFGFKIIARALRDLGGRISVLPAPAGGSLFRIDLSLRPAASGGPLEEGEAALTATRILLVEDDATAQALLSRLLTEAGAQVRAVATVDEATKAIRERATGFDIALLDITLPDGDGFDLARQLRVMGRTKAMRLVGLTAQSGAALQERARQAGLDLLLTKPLGARALRQALSGLRAQAPLLQPVIGGDWEAVLNAAHIEELCAEMGRAATFHFMRKALDEARSVLGSYTPESDIRALRKRVHSAIGASGLTGLAGVERLLREVQRAAQAGGGMSVALNRLSEMVERTELAVVEFSGRDTLT